MLVILFSYIELSMFFLKIQDQHLVGGILFRTVYKVNEILKNADKT